MENPFRGVRGLSRVVRVDYMTTPYSSDGKPNPQAIHDMLEESSKERLVDKRQIREMRHQAGVRYVDFTPAMVVVGAMVVATRYVALGIGDRSLYVMAGIGAALFLSIRFFMFKGAGKANQ